ILRGQICPVRLSCWTDGVGGGSRYVGDATLLADRRQRDDYGAFHERQIVPTATTTRGGDEEARRRDKHDHGIEETYRRQDRLTHHVINDLVAAGEESIWLGLPPRRWRVGNPISSERARGSHLTAHGAVVFTRVYGQLD